MLDKQIRKFQIPFKEEGFDEIIIHKFHNVNAMTTGELIAKMKDFDQKNPHHTMTLENHCFNTYDLFTEKEYKAEYNMGAVLHDYGKLYCQTIDENGIAHYYDHPSVGCYLVLESLMEEFNKVVLDICFLINYHMMPFNWDTDKAKQRWKERFGEYKYKLYIMCGLSGSGKSTIATQIANENPNTIIVSSDAIREELTGNYEDQEHNEEVFKIFHDRIRKNLENKKNVIADATNLTMKSRRAIMMKVNVLNIRKVCVIIPKPFEQCKEDKKSVYCQHR